MMCVDYFVKISLTIRRFLNSTTWLTCNCPPTRTVFVMTTATVAGPDTMALLA